MSFRFQIAKDNLQINTNIKLTVFGHSDIKTLLEAAVLASISRHFVDDALFVAVTCVLHVLLYTSPKETLLKKKITIHERKHKITDMKIK